MYPEGAKYRVAAGHRRLIAAKAVKLATCPCRVFEDGEEIAEALKHHENAIREDLNAAQESKHFALLLEKHCAGDIDKLCALVHERREYVEQRIQLLAGDPRVFQALSDKAITIGVARELNLINRSDTRMMFLESALTSGATVRMVRDWRIRGNYQDQISNGETIVIPPSPMQPEPPAQVWKPHCYLCEGTDDAHDMELLHVHRSCAKAVQRLAVRDAAHAEENGGKV